MRGLLRYLALMEWQKATALVPYKEALHHMEQRVEDIAAHNASEQCWLVEHPPIYTAGTSAKAQDLLNSQFPVFETGRGGQYTYHGPGQRIVYVMLNLKQRYAPATADIRHFVYTLEQWIIDTLASFDIKGERREGRIGIWVTQGNSENKIAALGIRIRKGISFHGIAINHSPDLTHYQGIVPCGIQQYGVTSMQALGVNITMETLDNALHATCPFL